MLKCKHEYCQYPNCNGENCGVPVENLLAYMCAELNHQREIPRQIYRAVAATPVSNVFSEIKRFFPEEYPITCPYGYNGCISDPAYIRKYHPEWWVELGRPTTCEHGEQLFTQGKECPYYDDEDK